MRCLFGFSATSHALFPALFTTMVAQSPFTNTLADIGKPVSLPVSSQPEKTAPMQVGGNRNAHNCPIGPDKKRDWSFGLFDCFSRCNGFCWSLWCPCVVYSYNRQRLRSLQNQGTPLPRGSESLDTYCCIYSALDCTGFSWILQIQNRADIRERYDIRGSTVGDCFASWCCRPCSLSQERREIELEENSFYLREEK